MCTECTPVRTSYSTVMVISKIITVHTVLYDDSVLYTVQYSTIRFSRGRRRLMSTVVVVSSCNIRYYTVRTLDYGVQYKVVK